MHRPSSPALPCLVFIGIWFFNGIPNEISHQETLCYLSFDMRLVKGDEDEEVWVCMVWKVDQNQKEGKAQAQMDISYSKSVYIS